ncbi:hypothetical protein PR048_005996, partial [Dryococelus australis]
MFFTQTLRISVDRIDGYLNKYKSDNRGKVSGVNRLNERKVGEVISLINRFPRNKSHYCRAHTSSNFLPQHVTINVMYDLYKNEYSEPVSLPFYKKIFCSKFNLWRKPLKDICNVCDALNTRMKDHDVPDLRQKLEAHKEAAEMARTEMKNDINHASVFTDLALWLYNCGIHDGSSKNGYCYIWVEGQAGRGAQEVGLCLRKHLMEHLPEGKKHLILWSDSCRGQNRNIKLVLMLKAVLASHPTLETDIVFVT